MLIYHKDSVDEQKITIISIFVNMYINLYKLLSDYEEKEKDNKFFDDLSPESWNLKKDEGVCIRDKPNLDNLITDDDAID